MVVRRRRHRSAAVPAGVSAAAVAEGRDVPDENLIRAERVPYLAAARWPGDPLAINNPNKFALMQRRQASRGPDDLRSEGNSGP